MTSCSELRSSNNAKRSGNREGKGAKSSLNLSLVCHAYKTIERRSEFRKCTRRTSENAFEDREKEKERERKEKEREKEGTSSLGKQDVGHPGNSCSAE